MSYTDDLHAWAVAALIRAIKTYAQTAAALIVTDAPVGFTDLDWIRIASVAGVAAVLSLLTSVKGIPEVSNGESALSIAGREQ